MVKMRFQCHRNTHTRGTSWKWRSTNGRRKSQSNQGIENTNKSKGCRKLLRLCKLLLTIYQRFQPHYSTIKLTKRKRRIEIDRKRTKCI